MAMHTSTTNNVGPFSIGTCSECVKGGMDRSRTNTPEGRPGGGGGGGGWEWGTPREVSEGPHWIQVIVVNGIREGSTIKTSTLPTSLNQLYLLIPVAVPCILIPWRRPVIAGTRTRSFPLRAIYFLDPQWSRRARQASLKSLDGSSN